MTKVTYTEKLAPDVTLESRLTEEGQVQLVAIVLTDSRSTAEAQRAVGRAAEVLKDDPRPVDRVEVRLGPNAERAILAARSRRKQKLDRQKARAR